MPVSAKEYQDLVRREMARYHGSPKGGEARDKAIRSANIAAGYGNSTALKHPSSTREGRVERGSAESEAPIPRSRPKDGGGGSGVPIPKSRPDNFPPDLAVSPPHERWPGATGDNKRTSPDLAVSPPHERWPGATSMPVQVMPVVPNPGLMGVPQDLRHPAAAGAGLGGQQQLLQALLGGNSQFPARYMPIDWLGGQ